MAKNDIGSVIGSIAIGVVGGLIAAEILSKLFEKRCPNCNSKVSHEQECCYNCGCRLK